jgi:hypothetical protein
MLWSIFDRAAILADFHARRQQYLYFPQMPGNLFRNVSLSAHP